ncbi:MAG: beta-Ala-His dipeptidase [Eubacterium sp.]
MLEQMDYKTIFHYFEEISNIPRGSYHNEKISNYLVQFAKEQGLFYRQEECGNVIMWKPASPECKSDKTVMLQGHMDMVCVCEDDSHDFETEGLNLQIHGDWLEAEKTTLGGDDGIALAYILAIFADDTLSHPALEAVITVDEEVGMDGAAVLDTTDLKADYLINIDNEEEGVLLVSCAGGASVDVFVDGKLEKQKGIPIEICISGLCGGHSGTEIAKHPTNASILMGRLLQGVEESVYLHTVTGGNKDNVITGKASATILCAGDADAVCAFLQQKKEQLCREFVAAEPGLTIDIVRKSEMQMEVFSNLFTKQFVDYLSLTITGVQVMSAQVQGMVESSLNLGVVQTESGKIHMAYSVRSQKETYKEYMISQITALASHIFSEETKAEVVTRGEYPAWDYRENSVLREVMTNCFEKQFGEKPRVEGIHAGLECGILLQKLSDLDIVSMGPEIQDIHTVKEKLSISSAKRNFDYLLDVLATLAEMV